MAVVMGLWSKAEEVDSCLWSGNECEVVMLWPERCWWCFFYQGSDVTVIWLWEYGSGFVVWGVVGLWVDSGQQRVIRG